MKPGDYILVPHPENKGQSEYATVLEDLGDSVRIEYDDEGNTQNTIRKSDVLQVVEEA